MAAGTVWGQLLHLLRNAVNNFNQTTMICPRKEGFVFRVLSQKPPSLCWSRNFTKAHPRNEQTLENIGLTWNRLWVRDAHISCSVTGEISLQESLQERLERQPWSSSMVVKDLKSHFLFSTQLTTSQTQLLAAISVLHAETAWKKKIQVVTRSSAQSFPCLTHQGPELCLPFVENILWN